VQFFASHGSVAIVTYIKLCRTKIVK